MSSDEKIHVVLTDHNETLKEREDFVAKLNVFYFTCKFEFIDLSDAKIQHSITHHSLQNMIVFCHPTHSSLMEDHKGFEITSN